MTKTKSTSEHEKSMRYKRDRDREKVKGLFHFPERPGGNLKFDFQQYAGDPMQQYNLWDGEVYEIPRGVARHLNNSGYLPKMEYYKNDIGEVCLREARKARRYSFENYDFFELEDIGEKNISQVEKV